MSSASQIKSIEELNTDTYDAFVTNIHLLFEPAPPLARYLYSKRPFKSWAALLDCASEALQSRETCSFSQDELLAIINAHPRIGAPKTTLSAASFKEQGYQSSKSIEDSCSISAEDQLVLERLRLLNEQYEERHGFKFIVFVNGRPKKELIPVIEERIRNEDSQAELWLGLKEMMAIARSRLQNLTQGS